MKKYVYLSPSKQENNKGVGTYGTEEYRMNQIADVVEKCLTASGIGFYRNNPEWELSQIVANSNTKDVVLHFAMHSNAANGKAQGGEVLVYKKGGEAEKFANILYEYLEPMTPSADRGVKENPDLYELKNTKAPAVLVEYAFHDNTEDAKFIIEHIEELGIVSAKAICKYLNVTFKNPCEVATVTKSTNDLVYKVDASVLKKKGYKSIEIIL